MRGSWIAAVCCLVLLVGSGAHAQTAEEAQSARGRKLLDMQGCTACHSLDGSLSAGPTFLGKYGTEVEVLRDGRPSLEIFDAAYLRESVEDPGSALSKGFAPGVMPRFTLTDEQLAAISATLAHLGDVGTGEHVEAESEREPEPLSVLALFVLLFVALHLSLSGDALRARLVRTLGERGFLVLYSVLVTGALAGMSWSYRAAPHIELWPSSSWLRYVPLVGMPLALVLLATGLTTKTPTQVGQEAMLHREHAAVGIQRVTRHPQLWAYAIFSFTHMVPNGDAASLLFFGAFFALSVFGMVHIEHRRALAHGDDWARFAAQTSVLPFAAILQGRNQLRASEIGGLRIVLALVLYGLLLAAHATLFGASPLP